MNNPFATNKPILPCKHIDEAFTIGQSDADTEATGSMLPCNCTECRESYAAGACSRPVYCEPETDEKRRIT